ncbi:MAG: hypothetical protein ACQESH_01580 [Campylobacterota bacterium]
MKKLLVAAFFSVVLWGQSLDEVITGLVDTKQYDRHKALIDALFSDEKKFYKGSEIDVVAVAEVLKDNGLLELFYDSPQTTTITFSSNSKHTLFLKLINDTLQQMGFTYYFIDHVQYRDSKMQIQISYPGNYAIDPLILAQRLGEHNTKISKMQKTSKYSYEYVINMYDTRLDVQQLHPEENFDILKAINDVILDVSLGKKVQLQPLSGSLWYPQVILYDKNLNIIEVITDDRIRKSLNVTLTNQTHYISISDLYQMENLNGGMRVKLRGER